MKKILIAVAFCLILVTASATPVSAKSGSVGALKADIVLANTDTVVGFAVFNTNGIDGLNVEVSVKDLPAGTYILRVKAPNGPIIQYEGALIIGANGKGNAHVEIPDLVFQQGATTIPCRVNIINPDTGPVAWTSPPVVGLPVPLK